MDRSSETGVTVRIYIPTIVKIWTYHSKVLIHCMSTMVYHSEIHGSTLVRIYRPTRVKTWTLHSIDTAYHNKHMNLAQYE